MTALGSLIRLQRRQLDEKRRDLATLQDREQTLVQQLARLDADFEAEQAAARDSPAVGFTFAAYLQAFKRKRAQVTTTLSGVRRQIAKQEEAIAEAFQSLKRLEIAQDVRTAEELAELRRQETLALDEQAAMRFQRRARAADEDPGDR